MAVFTGNIGLGKPQDGEHGWSQILRDNCDKVDAEMGALKTIIPSGAIASIAPAPSSVPLSDASGRIKSEWLEPRQKGVYYLGSSLNVPSSVWTNVPASVSTDVASPSILSVNNVLVIPGSGYYVVSASLYFTSLFVSSSAYVGIGFGGSVVFWSSSVAANLTGQCYPSLLLGPIFLGEGSVLNLQAYCTTSATLLPSGLSRISVWSV